MRAQDCAGFSSLYKCIAKFLIQFTCHSSKVQVPGNSSSLEHSPATGYDAKPLSTEATVTKCQH